MAFFDHEKLDVYKAAIEFVVLVGTGTHTGTMRVKIKKKGS